MLPLSFSTYYSVPLILDHIDYHLLGYGSSASSMTLPQARSKAIISVNWSIEAISDVSISLNLGSGNP